MKLTAQDKFLSGVFNHPGYSKEDWITYLVNFMDISEDFAARLTDTNFVICNDGHIFLSSLGNTEVLGMRPKFYLEVDNFPEIIFSRSYLSARYFG